MNDKRTTTLKIAPLDLIRGSSVEEICAQLRAAIYAAGSNVHNLALWSDRHEGNLSHRLNGKVDMAVGTLIDLQRLVNKYLMELQDDGA